MIYAGNILAATGLKKQPKQNRELCNIEKSLLSNGLNADEEGGGGPRKLGKLMFSQKWYYMGRW